MKTEGYWVPQRDAATMSKVAQWVRDSGASGKEIEFLVVLTEQANLSRAEDLSTKAEKARFVRDSLWNMAQATQGPIIEWLTKRNIEHRSYYIVNLIWVKATLDVAIELASRPDVVAIEGNPTIHNNLEQPDPIQLPENGNAPESIEPGISYTNAPSVWALGYTGQGIVIGGADTGYLWTHNAVKNKYRGWNGSTADHNYNWHDSIHTGGGACGANSTQPCDDSGHGTHTMGTATGDDGGTNQIGMAPGAKWIGCRNMDQGDGTPARYIECFEFFLAPYPVGGTPAQGDPTKAPDVTTNSWSCPPSEGCSANSIQAAIEAQRAAGIMTVVAATNSGPSCSTISDPPAIYDASYSVGALNTGTDNIASFSSRGPVLADGSNRTKPDISAPGTSTRSCSGSNIAGYVSLSGTSMATPHVAGAVALLLSAQPSLRGNVDAIEMVLNNAAVHLNSTSCSSSGFPNNVFGYGRINILAAVQSVLTTVSPAGQGFSSRGGQGRIDVTAPSGFTWTAVSNSPWINLISGGGTGNGKVDYVVRDNTSSSPRQGTITVASRTFTVTQEGRAPASCAYTISPTGATFSSLGGTGTITITTGAQCAWKTSFKADWITLTSACCGIGNGTVSFTVSKNNLDSARVADITIGDKVFHIKQNK